MTKYLSLLLIYLFVVGTVVLIGLWQGLASFVFAWVVHFMLMMAVLYSIWTFKPPMTSTYFDDKPWEDGGRIYTWIGVHWYRKILVWVGWERLHKTANPVKKDADALRHLEYSTRESECGHSIIFVIVAAFAVFVGIYHGWSQSIWLHVLNIVLNAYPIAVQRYNRPRLHRAVGRMG